MFGILKSKKKKQVTLDAILQVSKPAVEVDGMFMTGCIERALRGLGQNGKFQGALSELTAFKCQTMPDGIEVAGSAEKQTSAILAENAITLATVGATPLHWSHLAAQMYCQHAYGVELDWQTEGADLVSTLALGPNIEIQFTAKDCDHVDPVWSGEKLQGASLTMHARPVPAQGGMH